MARFLSSTTTCLALMASPALAVGGDLPALERALAWIPEEAISFIAVPSLKGLSDDVSQLIETTGQGGLLSMGRPIDLLKSQLGIGANLDEKGAVVAYFPPSLAAAGAVAQPAGTRPMPVVIVATTDGEAFLKANLTAAPDKGDGAFTSANGTIVFARALENNCVALAPTKESLPAALPAHGIGERFQGRLKPAEIGWLDRADLVAWASRDALRAAVESARLEPIPDDVSGGALNRGQQEGLRTKGLEIIDMLADGMVVVDVDPLGIFIAAVGVAEPVTPLAAVMAGGDGKPARLDRIPQNPFYLALSVDIDGLGGVAKFGELLDLADMKVGVAPRTLVPEWIFTEGADLAAVQMAAYPSKLGVAIGGVLNDSALFVSSRDPAHTIARMKQSLEALAGEVDGIRREPSWNPEKKLKSGDIVTAFEVKETVVDVTKRAGIDYERLAKQFIFGARGLNGLVKQRDDGVVVTFSQRPDVYGRAVEAAAGTNSATKSLAGDETVKSIEAWLPEQRDIELMIGLGPLVNMVGQVASSFVSEEQVKSMMPQIAKDAAPIALAVELGQGRVATVLVLPADVLKAIAQAAAQQRAAAPAPVPVPAPVPAPVSAPAPAPASTGVGN